MPELNPQKRRRQRWIEKKFQRRIISRFALTALGSIVVANGMILAYMKIQEWLKPSGQDLIYLSNAMTESIGVSKVFEVLWPPMLASLLLAGVFSIISSLLFSHRIAGPVFNLKRMFRQVEEGNMVAPMRTRKTDELKDVEESFNHMLQSLNTRLSEIQSSLEETTGPGKKKIQSILNDLKIGR